MMLVLGRDAEVAQWVGERTAGFFERPFVAIGIADREGGAIVGGIIFHDWNGSNIEATVAMARPIRRGEVQGLRHYVFSQLKARRLTLRVEAGNRQAERFCRRHAALESALPHFFEGADGLQFVIFADDPRWLKYKVEV